MRRGKRRAAARAPAGIALLLAAAAAAQQPAPPPAPARRVAVVAVALDPAQPAHRGYLAVARAAAAFHHGFALDWDGRDGAQLRTRLRDLGPRLPTDVLLVVPPSVFDVMLHRKVLLALTGLDDVPFVDATFGWLTARDGEALARLWQRTEQVHRRGLANRTWHSAAVTSGMKSANYVATARTSSAPPASPATRSARTGVGGGSLADWERCRTGGGGDAGRGEWISVRSR